ncbi:4'-phosphopantetheinyl transferase family protein [Dokdonia sp. 4H-3-7-5]|jgi:4'-phosphopantetheinyl transferase|uniref:4'-phosphopantetheinyl transferase family protein n=1 Tax=Dokdonia sp. (strain 4H-3-7-5) TaxID=983548 RepID=UPI00020A7AA9|nr:4'-phosphopantetheinyl transferase superfamily protein [Dokdonia sp. 4H-3-7-5]AEE19352.1 siderophore (surfactin) biosynthesis regulatory protein [Dokdonia sp. 4H-3-7-5]
MPLYKTITVSSSTTVYIWKIEEDITTLSRNIKLTDHCQNRLQGMKSELHQRGFMSIRHLLAEAGYTDFDLYYDKNGKPHLHDGKHISITHSYTFTAIIVSNQPVGIDIEKQRDKILRIAHKFTPIEEYYTLTNADARMRKLTIVWGAKESLYKLYSQEGLSFLKHIDVTDFDFDDGKTIATVNYEGVVSTYDLTFMEFEGFTCVYGF